jgi:hypothetical protein
MRAAGEHLAKELNGGRIMSDQYATVYTAIVATVMEQSIQFLLGRARLNLEIELNELNKDKVAAEINLLIQKLVTEKAQVMDRTVLDPTATEATTHSVTIGEGEEAETQYWHNSVQLVAGVTGRKNDTFERQIAGYDDDYKLKVARTILEAYKVIFANSLENEIFVDGFQNDNISSLIELLRIDAEIPHPEDP